MKFLIMSDNHGRHSLVQELVKAFQGQVDYFFHCGDSEFAASDPIWQVFAGNVTGNMDFDAGYAQERVVETPVGRVLLVHGHRHQVNQSNDLLLQIGLEDQVQFIFHGHTHRLYSEYRQGILMVNPGSLNHSRGPVNQTTFAIVTVEPDRYQVEFRDEEGKVVDGLTQVYAR